MDLKGFNPRAREGATGFFMSNDNKRVVSIHAPVKARPILLISLPQNNSFNPRAREGAT